jgi:hypothetical protein
MHYRTERVGFLEPADEFLDLAGGGGVHRSETTAFDTDEVPGGVVVPAVP